MKPSDARTIALQAVARGWIGAAEVWDAAVRWATSQERTPPEELFAQSLDPEQVALLSLASSPLVATEAQGHLDDGEPPVEPEPFVMPGELGVARYELGEPLGSGGAGRVTAALDRETGRVVALKALNRGPEAPPQVTRRFVEEARVTAQLEHPSIVPVYDIGALPDGQPFYTMRVVKKQSLRDVLARPELRRQWPLVRLLGALQQVSRALAYAHARGVLHRDIKPENILLGDFGEVYLADWGLARVERVGDLALVGSEPSHDGRASSVGGTPGYIAPEALRGDDVAIDRRADLFALGVVLYEILTGAHPFEADTVVGITLATCEKHPTRPRELVPTCPLTLEDLCLSLLAKDPAHRPSSAESVADEIEAFLEGAKERERRRDEALRLCREAREPFARYEALEEDRRALVERARAMADGIKGWEPVEKKRAVWALEDRASEAEREGGRALAQAIELYTKALGYDAQCEDAHRGLADLYWSRARASDAERRPAATVYYEALVTEHDVGVYAALLGAEARLTLRSNPPGAHVVVQRYEERDRVLVAGPERHLGRTPLVEARLEPGSYLVTLKGAGFCDARYPVLLARGAHHEGDVNLYRSDEIGDGFVYVPGGPAILGGDPEANAPIPAQTLVVPDFAIARFPVTLREYCAFLDELDRTRPELVAKRAPHDLRASDAGLAVRRGGSGRWEPDPVMIEGEARKMFPAGEGHEWNVPVHLIDWFDAVAYCRFRSERDGTLVRLPTEIEWEKAARGADGRHFPWGDHFDPTFCLMRDARPFPAQPEPVGTFPTDESPYGVRDMAGGMREWVADLFGERTADQLAAEPEPEPGSERGDSGFRMVRSGSWITDRTWPRSASRGGQFALVRGTGLGFRLAKALSPRRARG